MEGGQKHFMINGNLLGTYVGNFEKEIIMVGEYGFIKMEELRRKPIKTDN